MTASTTYRIIAAVEIDGRVERGTADQVFPSYDAALAVWDRLPAQWGRFAVRSSDDPMLRRCDSYAAGHQASLHVREAIRKAIGARATELLREMPTASFYQVQSELASFARNVLGIPGGAPDPERPTVEWSRSVARDALKARVRIARCSGEHRRGFYWPSREGRVADKRCPECGTWLKQTSLALNVSFQRLPKEA